MRKELLLLASVLILSTNTYTATLAVAAPNPMQLIFNARKGDLAKVQELVEMGADVNYANTRQRTALTSAARKDHYEVVKFLINSGAKVNHKTNYFGWTATFIAVSEGHLKVVELLLQNGAQINAKDESGSTMLKVALDTNHYDIADLLIKNGANVNTINNNGQSLLLTYIEAENQKSIDYLLSHGANVNTQDTNGNTLLHKVSAEGNVESLKRLFKYGAKTGIANKKGETPLLLALKNGHQEVAKLLIKRGGNIDAVDSEGDTPLHKAVKLSDQTSIKSLLELGANLKLKGSSKEPIIFDAITYSNSEVGKLLISNGASLNTKNSNGDTPLTYAIKLNKKGFISLLKKKGLKLNYAMKQAFIYKAIKENDTHTLSSLLSNRISFDVRNSENESPFYYAVKTANIETVQFFLENGYNANKKFALGKTPLFLAIEENEKVVELLLKKGAKVDVKENQGLTPFDYAIFNKKVEALKQIALKTNVKKEHLYRAIKVGDVSIIEVLVQKGAQLDWALDDKTTPLMMAVLYQNSKVVSYLASFAKYTDLQDENGNTALHIAALIKNRSIYNLLSKKVNKEIRNYRGKKASQLF